MSGWIQICPKTGKICHYNEAQALWHIELLKEKNEMSNPGSFFCKFCETTHVSSDLVSSRDHVANLQAETRKMQEALSRRNQVIWELQRVIQRLTKSDKKAPQYVSQSVKRAANKAINKHNRAIQNGRHQPHEQTTRNGH